MSTTIPRYNPAAIEAKWQQEWERLGLYQTVEDPDRPKWYALTMLPYPSGDLHVGHWYAMTPSDTAARYRRMQGTNVFFPIGFDAFGLPAENAAIAHGINPRIWTYDNIDNMRRQLRQNGRDVGLGPRGGHLRARVLQVVAMVLPAPAGGRPRLPREGARGLVPELQHHPGPRTGLGRGQALRTVWHSGHPKGTGAVEVPHHQLCR